MADGCGGYGYGYQYDYNRRGGDEEFDEEEVWAVMKDGSPKVRKVYESSISTTARQQQQLSASRMIPKSNGHPEGGGGRGGVRQSAPINIPDWSKVCRKKRSSEIHGWYHGINEFSNEIGCLEAEDVVTSYLVSDDHDDDDGMIPPHEWIAKKLLRNQISSFSVFEGRGRTLKGRDLSKVRNAVLTSTGFIE